MIKTVQLKFLIYRILKKITSKFETYIGDRNLQESYIKNSNYHHSMVDLNEKYYLNQYLFHCKKYIGIIHYTREIFCSRSLSKHWNHNSSMSASPNGCIP